MKEKHIRLLYPCNSNNDVQTKHIDFKWLTVDELDDLDWAAADIPIVEKLMRGIDE